VNLLSRAQDDLSARFAVHGIDKFDGVSWTAGPETGCALFSGVLVSLECVVETALPTGDHEVFVGAIRRVHAGASDDPLVYFRGNYAGLVPSP
jgi:3-hydroxy-9,10-secoandrosta-1,3,5(10)-triene-9,17-dione monooxygenase reductase component